MNESMRLPKEWLEVESILKDAVSGFSDVRGYLRDGDALSADRRLSRIAEDLRAVNGIFAAFSIRAVSVTTPTVED